MDQRRIHWFVDGWSVESEWNGRKGLKVWPSGLNKSAMRWRGKGEDILWSGDGVGQERVTLLERLAARLFPIISSCWVRVLLRSDYHTPGVEVWCRVSTSRERQARTRWGMLKRSSREEIILPLLFLRTSVHRQYLGPSALNTLISRLTCVFGDGVR